MVNGFATGDADVPLEPPLRRVAYEAIADELRAEGVYEQMPAGWAHADVVVRTMRTGRLKALAAHAVALHVEGFHAAGGKAGEAAIRRGTALTRRDENRLPRDPSPVRGPIEKCCRWSDAKTIRPSLTLPVGLLRTLRFLGARASDLAALWYLLAMSARGASAEATVGELARRLGISDRQRVTAMLARLNDAIFSSDPSLKRRDQFPGGRAIELAVAGKNVRWSIAPELMAATRVVAGGSRWAHLDLVTVRGLETPAQEQGYRQLLAAAAEAGAWSEDGGRCRWHLTPAEASVCFGARTSHVKEVRRYLDRLRTSLQASGGRLQLGELVVSARDAHSKGRRAERVSLDIIVQPARPAERPRIRLPGSGEFFFREADRSDSIVAEIEGRHQKRRTVPPQVPARICPAEQGPEDEVDAMYQALSRNLSAAGQHRAELERAERELLMRQVGLDPDDPELRDFDVEALIYFKPDPGPPAYPAAADRAAAEARASAPEIARTAPAAAQPRELRTVDWGRGVVWDRELREQLDREMWDADAR